MNLESLIVRLNALVFLSYGLGFLFFPAPLAQMVTDATPNTSSALIDLRATYGGMSIALGGLFFVLASRQDWLKAGLIGVVLVMLGMAAGRSLGIFLDGAPNTIMLLYLGLEVLVAAVAAWLLFAGTKNE